MLHFYHGLAVQLVGVHVIDSVLDFIEMQAEHTAVTSCVKQNFKPILHLEVQIAYKFLLFSKTIIHECHSFFHYVHLKHTGVCGRKHIHINRKKIGGHRSR